MYTESHCTVELEGRSAQEGVAARTRGQCRTVAGIAIISLDHRNKWHKHPKTETQEIICSD